MVYIPGVVVALVSFILMVVLAVYARKQEDKTTGKYKAMTAFAVIFAVTMVGGAAAAYFMGASSGAANNKANNGAINTINQVERAEAKVQAHAATEMAKLEARKGALTAQIAAQSALVA